MIKKILLVFLILTSFLAMFLSERPFYFALPFWGLLVSLCYIDYKSMKLPNMLTAAVLVLGIGYNFQMRTGYLIPLSSFVIALSSLLLISLLYLRVRKKQGIGMGDVKLFAAGAVWINPYLLPIVMLISSLGAIICVLVFWREEFKAQLNRKIPFGPFLATAIWVIWLFEEKLLLLIG